MATISFTSIVSKLGWVGSHVAHEALKAGLNIKLAIRNESKAEVVIDALEAIHGKGRIETVVVKDFAQEGAYDEAVKNVQGVIHTASDVSNSANADVVIKAVLKGYSNLFEAADKQKSIRRIVLTSSTDALNTNDPSGKTKQHLDVNSWNDAAVEAVKTHPTVFSVYSASKTLSERYAWDSIKTRKPSFVLNTIVPAFVFGAAIPGIPITSTGQWLVDSARGKPTELQDSGAGFHIDVDDVALLHIKALTREDVKNERILALGEHFNFNTVIDVIKKIKPDAPTLDKRPEWDITDNSTFDVKRANELLEERGGIQSMKYSFRRNLKDV
jgi:nucleoside-diphosphate-sugar epimerase